MPGSGATPPYGYGAQGDFASLPLGNGLTRTFTFNSRLQTTAIRDSTGATYPLWSASLGWGTTANNGNLMSANYTTSLIKRHFLRSLLQSILWLRQRQPVELGFRNQ